MPWIAFFANGIWVLVIGLMGPSVPFIIEEFSIDYSQAGLIFSILSIAAFFGTFFGGWVSDYKRRKFFWLLFLAVLAAGLVSFGFAPGYLVLLAVVFVMSLFGSPIGAVGQSIMLQMFPEKRGSFLSLSTMFAAIGSFSAPILISLSFLAGFRWRAAFYITALMVFVLLVKVVFTRLPKPVAHTGSSFSIFKLFGDWKILFHGLMIFLAVGIDMGFSYWLAEYFIKSAGAAAEISGFAVGCYLAGIILGRFINSKKPDRISLWAVCSGGLVLTSAALFAFLNLGIFQIKLVLAFLYGLGLAPIFPSMLASGTALYPTRSGAVTAILFSMMSLSGAVFPFMVGSIGTGLGIEKAYYSLYIVIVLIAAGLILGWKIIRQPGGESRA